jgi:hypothetical protein
LHRSQLIAGRIAKMKTATAWKGKRGFGDRAARSAHTLFGSLEGFHPNYRKRRCSRFVRVSLQPEINLAAHGARIGRSEFAHLIAKRGGIKGFGWSDRGHWQLDKTNPVQHFDTSRLFDKQNLSRSEGIVLKESDTVLLSCPGSWRHRRELAEVSAQMRLIRVAALSCNVDPGLRGS